MIPGQLTHMDFWGKYNVVSINGHQYYILLIDDSTRYITIHFLKWKDEAVRMVKEYTMPHWMFGHPPMFGHFKYLAHFLSDHYQIEYTHSSTIYECFPGIFGMIILLFHWGQIWLVVTLADSCHVGVLIQSATPSKSIQGGGVEF